MTTLLRLASLIFNQPHLITPQAAEAILHVFNGRVEGELIIAPEASRFHGEPAVRDRRWQGYNVTKHGVAIIPIIGELTNRGAYLGADSGVVSYEGVRQQLRNAASDPQVRSIVLDIDSPGGFVHGMAETSALVREISATKPITAVANSLIASAAYGIASGANRIVATESSEVGSVGVVFAHADRSAEMARRGVKVTLIHSGAHKVDGNPFAPLPDAVKADIQGRCDRIYAGFIATILQGRPQLDEARLRNTEARCYDAHEAVVHGLADEVGTFEGAVADAEAGKVPTRQQKTAVPASPPPQQAAAKTGARHMQMNTAAGSGFEHMTLGQLNEAVSALRATLGITETEAAAATAHVAAAAGAPQPAANAPPAPAPVAPPQPAPAPAPALATPPADARSPHAQGQAAERARIKAILGHAEAKERQVQAHVLALETDMAADQAAAILAQLPKEQQAKAGAAAFYSAIAAQGGNPRIPHLASETVQPRTSSLVSGMDKIVAKGPKRPPQALPARQ